MKPSSGGSLKSSRPLMESSSATLVPSTAAVLADLPVLSSMLSRLFESSQYLDDVALHHLIDALRQLSQEALEVAYSNRVCNAAEWTFNGIQHFKKSFSTISDPRSHHYLL